MVSLALAGSGSMALPGILHVPEEKLQTWLKELSEPPLRAKQIRRHLFSGHINTFEEMTDLPKPLRQHLAESFKVFATRVDHHHTAKDGTHKLVLRLEDDHRIECVLIQEGPRATACISTQVGCGMGCVFCASGLNGVVRNLTTAEILEQLLRLRHWVEPPRTRLSHIVVMGMGEPLANLENLLNALAIATDKSGLGISARHITISTVGLPAKIRQLANVGKPYHLAVSLHAPNDDLRTQIVPTNDKVGLNAILEAADEFFRLTGRQVTYEYVLLGGLNDQGTHARQLAERLRGRKAHVNLIPWNNVPGLPFRRPRDVDVTLFCQVLRNVGISVKVRKRKGSEIDAACGQLRRELDGKHPLPLPQTLIASQNPTAEGP